MKRLEPMTMEEAADELVWWCLSSDEDRERAFDDVLGNVCYRAVDDPFAADVLRRIRKRAEATVSGRHLAPRRTLLGRIRGLAKRA